jgi:hypothetical protein
MVFVKVRKELRKSKMIFSFDWFINTNRIFDYNVIQQLLCHCDDYNIFACNYKLY